MGLVPKNLRKKSALTSSREFFLKPRATVYIFGSVTIHILGISIESDEFQSILQD